MNLRRVNAGELNIENEVFYSSYRYEGEDEVSIDNADFEEVTVQKISRDVSPEIFNMARKHNGYPPADPPHKPVDTIFIKTKEGRTVETVHTFLWVVADH